MPEQTTNNPNTPERQHLLSVLAGLPDMIGDYQETEADDLTPLAQEERVAVSLNLNGQVITFIHDADPATQHLAMMEFDLGPVPEHLEQIVYTRLLDLNFRVSGRRLTAFAIDQTTGHVIYTCPLGIADLSPRALLTFLQGVFVLAERWQQDYFLEEARPMPQQMFVRA